MPSIPISSRDNDLTDRQPPYPYSYSYSYSPPHRVRVRVPLRCVRVRVRFWAELESVRKGIRFPDLTSLFPSGEPRAEAQRRGGVFELAWGGGSMLKSLPFAEIH
ncbi:MAG: hypothetical protein ACOX52_21865 [Verrucomicrobiota bacterium]